MKIIYEFDCSYENDDFYTQKIYQYANEMHASLLELERYLKELEKDNIQHDK